MRLACAITAGLLLCSSSCVAQAKDAAAAKTQPAAYKGCVTANANDPTGRVLKTGDLCMELAGKFKAAEVTGHEVTLMGTAVEAHGMDAVSLQVTSTRLVGPACTETCALQPPGTRGTKKNESHGHQGGTAGVTDTGRPPQ